MSESESGCIDVAPGKDGYVPPYACSAVYNYSPSFQAALAFSVLFSVITLAHLTIAVSFKKKFCWVIIMGCSWESGSFILRTLGSKDQQNVAFGTTSQILVLLAPLWINAYVYMVLGRMIYFFHPTQSTFGIKAVNLAKLFVWLDILSFIIQLSGGLLVSPGQEPKLLLTGLRIYQAGIAVQEAFLILFTVVAIRFHWHMAALERRGEAKKGWLKLLIVVYIALALITVRIIYRLAEFFGGIDEDNDLFYKEIYFYCLEAGPMVTATGLLAIVHPAWIIRGPNSEFPVLTRRERKDIKLRKRAEKKEQKEAKKLDSAVSSLV